SDIQQPADRLGWYVLLQARHSQSSQRIFQPGIGRSEVVPDLHDRADTRAARRQSFRQRRDGSRDCFKSGTLLGIAGNTTRQRPDRLSPVFDHYVQTRGRTAVVIRNTREAALVPRDHSLNLFPLGLNAGETGPEQSPTLGVGVESVTSVQVIRQCAKVTRTLVARWQLVSASEVPIRSPSGALLAAEPALPDGCVVQPSGVVAERNGPARRPDTRNVKGLIEMLCPFRQRLGTRCGIFDNPRCILGFKLRRPPMQ